MEAPLKTKTPLKTKALLIIANDWEGLFVNEKLIEEGHTLNQGYERISYFLELSKEHNFKLDEMEFGYVTKKYDEYLEMYGGFHKNSKDVDYKWWST